MAETFTFDAFITYDSVDAHYAERLHKLLSALGYTVFLDSEALLGGDPWPDRIRQAQAESLLTLILVSDRTAPYFQRAEILVAINIAREDYRRRVVPLYLTGRRTRGAAQHPLLTPLHGIYWEEGSLLNVAQKIEAALKASKQPQGGPHEIVLETVVIVTGCAHLPEIFDRPSAYQIKAAIDRAGNLLGRSFLRSIVIGDIWFLDHSHITGHPNVISVGSPGVNALTNMLAGEASLLRGSPDGRWKIMQVGSRWALFGDRAEDTQDAVGSFKDHDLPGFLDKIWSRP